MLHICRYVLCTTIISDTEIVAWLCDALKSKRDTGGGSSCPALIPATIISAVEINAWHPNLFKHGVKTVDVQRLILIPINTITGDRQTDRCVTARALQTWNKNWISSCPALIPTTVISDKEIDAWLCHPLKPGVKTGDVHVQPELDVLWTIHPGDQTDHGLVQWLL